MVCDASSVSFRCLANVNSWPFRRLLASSLSGMIFVLLYPSRRFANYPVNFDRAEKPASHPSPPTQSILLQNNRTFVTQFMDGERKTDDGVITNSNHSTRADDRFAFDAQFIQLAEDRAQKRFRLGETFNCHDACVECRRRFEQIDLRRAQSNRVAVHFQSLPG